MKIKEVILLFTISLVMQSCNAPSSAISVHELEGRWKFIAVERPVGNAWVTDPWMEGGVGYLIYNNKGHMALHITPAGYSDTRIKWDKDSLDYGTWPLFELMVEETGRYTLSNHVFTGNYSTLGDTLIHDWLSHSNPSNFGRKIIRRYDIESDTLFIYPPGPEPPVRVVYVNDN